MEEGHDGAQDAVGHAGVGSLAEEAAKLAGAFATWAAQHGVEAGRQVQGHVHDLAGAVREGVCDCAHRVGEHTATGAPECTVCPVCRTISVIRDVSPEVKGHLVTAATSLLAAATGLAGAFADARRPAPGAEPGASDDTVDQADEHPGDGHGASGERSKGRRPGAEGVQRIELDE